MKRSKTQVSTYLTRDELAAVDAARGDRSRSWWLREVAMKEAATTAKVRNHDGKRNRGAETATRNGEP